MDTMDRHGGQGRPRNQMLDPPSNMKVKVEPTFDYSQNTNVTALIGKTAYLTCRVRNLGDKSVRFLHFHRSSSDFAIFRVRISSSSDTFLERLFLIRDLFPSWNTRYCSGITRKIVRDRLMFQKNGYLYIYIYTHTFLSIPLLHGVSTNLWQEGNHDKGPVHR